MNADRLIVGFDKALRSLLLPGTSRRPHPAAQIPETVLSGRERRHAAALMRVNHAGEICAQALYQGQAMASRNSALRAELAQAAEEESEHLAWTAARIAELGGRRSLLDPFWYGGALAIGLLAGASGDRWNLGFLAETERQVGAHLDGHLKCLPPNDRRSRAVIEQMREDELAHAATAVRLGAAELPAPVGAAMRLASGLMTRVAYCL